MERSVHSSSPSSNVYSHVQSNVSSGSSFTHKGFPFSFVLRCSRVIQVDFGEDDAHTNFQKDCRRAPSHIDVCAFLSLGLLSSSRVQLANIAPYKVKSSCSRRQCFRLPDATVISLHEFAMLRFATSVNPLQYLPNNPGYAKCPTTATTFLYQ